MRGFWLALIGTVANAVIPVVVAWIQKLIPANHPKLQGMDKAAVRETHRQWVMDMLTEMANAIVAKKIIPAFILPLLTPVEAIVAKAIDAALDDAGF